MPSTSVATTVSHQLRALNFPSQLRNVPEDLRETRRDLALLNEDDAMERRRMVLE